MRISQSGSKPVCSVNGLLEYTEPWTGVNPPSQQTIISTATATDTQHVFLFMTDYATTGGEALWTLSNVFIKENYVPSVKTSTQIDLNSTCLKEFININIYINVYVPDKKKSYLNKKMRFKKK